MMVGPQTSFDLLKLTKIAGAGTYVDVTPAILQPQTAWYGRNLISYSEPFMNQQEKRFWPHSRNSHRNPLFTNSAANAPSITFDLLFTITKVNKLSPN